MKSSQPKELSLFSGQVDRPETPNVDRRKMREPFGRIDGDDELRNRLLPYCRLSQGEVWIDPEKGHRVGVADATDGASVSRLLDGHEIDLCLTDPPYNVRVGARNTEWLGQMSPSAYDEFSRTWLDAALVHTAPNSSLYVWLGADMKNGMHPLPEFCIDMRSRTDWNARNWITLRNQRGYGTQKNWMWVRQELLYYVKGSPVFNIAAEYTDIPKILRGYHKEVGGRKTENLERSKSETIRAGNVWVDVQQVFYRRHENVPGCYAQKPVKSIERIVEASSNPGSVVFDPFAHSGTTLIASEKLGRTCVTSDIDPIFAEIAIRRLERYRETGNPGWQCENPFPELLQ